MNLSEVNSVAELVLENEKTLTPTEKLIQALSHKDITPKQHLEVCKLLVDKLLGFHNWVVENKEDAHPQWSVDAQTLFYIHNMLETIAWVVVILGSTNVLPYTH